MKDVTGVKPPHSDFVSTVKPKLPFNLSILLSSFLLLNLIFYIFLSLFLSFYPSYDPDTQKSFTFDMEYTGPAKITLDVALGGKFLNVKMPVGKHLTKLLRSNSKERKGKEWNPLSLG